MFAGEVDLNSWYKPNIDKKILKKYSKRSDLKATIDISIFFILLLTSGYVSIFTWGTWWSILALLLYGNIFYCKIISIQHETNHETYFKSRLLNRFFYNLTSLLGGFEAVRWKWSHFHHHTHTIFTHEEVWISLSYQYIFYPNTTLSLYCLNSIFKRDIRKITFLTIKKTL